MADRRKIQVHTVAAYLADAIVGGHGYFWPACSISNAELECIQAQVTAAFIDGGECCVKSLRFLFKQILLACDGLLYKGYIGTPKIVFIEIQATLLWPAGAAAARRDILEELMHKGIGLKAFQEKLQIPIDFGKIRIGLAHIGRGMQSREQQEVVALPDF